MKTEEIKILEKIIMRDDYSKLSYNLAENTIRFAEIIRKKMTELEIEEIITNGLCLRTSERKTNSGLSIKFLCDEFGKSFEAYGDFYFANNFNCLIKSTNTKEKLKFLNNIKNILSYLDERETEKSKEIENTLEKIKDL